MVVTLAFATLLFKLEIDPELKNYFPKTMTSVVNTDRIEEVFGNQDLVMVIFETDDILKEETLKRVKKIGERIWTCGWDPKDILPVRIQQDLWRRGCDVRGAYYYSHSPESQPTGGSEGCDPRE